MSTNIFFLVIVGALAGAASGYLGSFMVLKRMSLVGDALSHVALPGIAIAITFGIDPILGALTALLLATIGIWYLGEHSEVYPEALVGIFFTASLALGLLLTPEPDLLEALFGNIDKISLADGIFTLVGAIVIFTVTKAISKNLLLGVVSKDLAKSQKINTSKVEFIYLALVALVVALGVKFLGTLLTGAMVIIPAVASKNISQNSRNYQFLAIIFGASSAILGIIAAKIFNLSSGPVIVLSAIFFFIISYIVKRK